ncbi:helix-turn-helix domain-containing protein [Streptomyces sp. NPDC097640]|uniref:helix-turn-helix domain-containing protein n=1 Tax=Streptomyces sp. NPDC097640 TaxID=3157229 RepID=UPI0033340EA2
MAVIGSSVRVVAACGRRPGLVPVELSVVEQRHRAVLAGVTVTEVAAQLRRSRQTVSGWKSRYAASGLAGLADRSRTSVSCPPQASAEVGGGVRAAARVSRLGPRRIAYVLERAGTVDPGAVPDDGVSGHGAAWAGGAGCSASAAGGLQVLAAGSTNAVVADGHCRRGVAGQSGRRGLTETKIVTDADDHSWYRLIA